MVKAAELQEVMWAVFNFSWSTGRSQVGGVPSQGALLVMYVVRNVV